MTHESPAAGGALVRSGPADGRTSEPRVGRVAAELLVQFLLICVAVFLGLQADQWREDREHRQKARIALENFRAEVAKNRATIEAVLPYHKALGDTVGAVLRSGSTSVDDVFARFRFEGAGFRGMRTATFQSAAWELALATQALSYVDGTLAFAIADVYHQQDVFEEINRSFMAGVFTPSFFAGEHGRGAIIAVAAYMGDVAYQEPHLLALYDRLQPKLDSALGLAAPSRR